MNPKYEMFKIVGMNADHPNQRVLDAIEKLGYTIVFPCPTNGDILCCMDEKTMEEYYCDYRDE